MLKEIEETIGFAVIKVHLHWSLGNQNLTPSTNLPKVSITDWQYGTLKNLAKRTSKNYRTALT